MTTRRLFKEVFMHNLCEKVPEMLVSEVCTQRKPKVSVPWHWNSVNDVIMLIAKDVSSIFTKTMFSL